MASSLYTKVFWLAVCASVNSVEPPKGTYDFECRDRYLLVAADLTYTGTKPPPRFEAIDATGVYPITKQYGSECGYSSRVLDQKGYVELRASYFSCHTHNQNDEVFTFKFNLVVNDQNDMEAKYNISAACSLDLPWSTREVTCEEDYMEVSVGNEGSITFSEVVSEEDWNVALTAYSMAASSWRVIFQEVGQQPNPLSLTTARELGYVFSVTAKRLVFRSPYGKQFSNIAMVSGFPVEVMRPMMLVREGLSLRMADLVVACPIYISWYDGTHLVWEAPALLPPLESGVSGLERGPIRMGINGKLLDGDTIAVRGYTMDVNNDTVHISIPLNAEEGYRRSFVEENTYIEMYTIQLYYEHLLMRGDEVHTRIRLNQQMTTPLLAWLPFTINQTVPEEGVFTVYLGNIPYDVSLASVKLNGQEIIDDDYSMTVINFPNGTDSYVFRVPFSDPVVSKKFLIEGYHQYTLDINYTLIVLPDEEPYYHLVSVTAQQNVLPPTFVGDCYEDGIRFTLEHQPFDYMWEVGIGPYPLTPELAAQRGYIMKNDSQSLVLDVPLFTLGYSYEEIRLSQFFGSFEILTRDSKTMAIKHSSTKSCRFNTTELIVCSPEGEMTVVANLTRAEPTVDPVRTTLLDPSCKPKEMDNTRVLFSFGLNTCGTRVQVDEQQITYQNVVMFHEEYSSLEVPIISRNSEYRLIVKCIYPVISIHRLTSNYLPKAAKPGLDSVAQTNAPILRT